MVTGITLLAALLSSFLTDPTRADVLEHFHKTTRPFGFWTPLDETGMWSIALGLAWLVCCYGLAALGVEPVATFFFWFAWAGLIFTLDRLIARAEGRSLVARLGAAPLACLVLWSAVNWFLYELANVRLQNWHYVLVTDYDIARCVTTVLAFGTVLPGVWIDHWLGTQDIIY